MVEPKVSLAYKNGIKQAVGVSEGYGLITRELKEATASI